MMTFRHLLPLLTLGLAGCASADPGHLTQTDWVLVELDGKPVPALQRPATLRFDDGHASGSNGCNRFHGTYTLDTAARTLSFGRLASTMMACTDGMQVERSLMAAFRTIDGYTLRADELTLDSAHVPIARFTNTPLR